MGIPSYFSYIIKNHSNIIRNLSYFKNIMGFQHLYMDCNSIVYDSVHLLEKLQKDGKKFWNTDFESAVIDEVIKKIDEYIRMINPLNTIFIAFDGVAPFAKMDQQRTRRYKSLFLSNLSLDDSTHSTRFLELHNVSGPLQTQKSWNTSAITPGTVFMDKLCHQIDYAFTHMEGKYNVKQIIVSCSDEPGEGEHKLYQNIRSFAHPDDNISVYGLDSDLIMLSIFHLKYCKNIYIFREAPEFLKSSIPLDVRGKENEPHFLDIKHLSSCILSEMACKDSDQIRIYDYVFLCFLLGNDFLPHFPAMNIRTHGIQALLDIYRLYIGNNKDRFFISAKTGKIQWKNVGIFINEIAKREHGFLINEFFVRDKMDGRVFKESTMDEKLEILQNVPIIYRADEKYICPNEPYWEKRYYKVLFDNDDLPTVGSDQLKQICNNYLEGLEWVFKYYTNGCPHWRWKYNYEYPPLFSDLCKYIPHFEMDFITDSMKKNQMNAFTPHVQLSYVLPGSNLHLLPPHIEQFLKMKYADLYPDKYDFKWAFCRYFWESHPILPEISVELLEQWEIQYRIINK